MPRRSARVEVTHASASSDPNSLPLPWDPSTFTFTSASHFHLPIFYILVPVYDVRNLCVNGIDIKKLESYKKDNLTWLDNVNIEVGAFVGILDCPKWIPSPKCEDKERVTLNIMEVYLLADPTVDDGYFAEWGIINFIFVS